jgi:Lipocalin-like domain
MVTAAEHELATAGVTEAPEVVVADAGYWHHDEMDQLASRGTKVLIAPDAGKRRGARPGCDGGRYAFMRCVFHHVELSLFPNWLGVTQERLMKISGAQLTLSTRPLLLQARQQTAHLLWERPCTSSSRA